MLRVLRKVLTKVRSISGGGDGVALLKGEVLNRVAAARCIINRSAIAPAVIDELPLRRGSVAGLIRGEEPAEIVKSDIDLSAVLVGLMNRLPYD
jgi:hypothetical protein